MAEEMLVYDQIVMWSEMISDKKIWKYRESREVIDASKVKTSKNGSNTCNFVWYRNIHEHIEKRLPRDRENIKNLLVGTFEVEDSTPYGGIIAGNSVWHIHQMIHYKKWRLPNCWYTELKKIAEYYDKDVKIETTFKKLKSK